MACSVQGLCVGPLVEEMRARAMANFTGVCMPRPLVPFASKSKWVCVGHLFKLFRCERRDCLRLIEPDVFVKLVRQNGLEIVAREFCFRPIDDADGALQTWLSQAFRCFQATVVQIEVKGRSAGLVAASLIALRNRRSHCLDLHRLVPVRCRCHGAGVRAKPDDVALSAKFLTT